MSFKRDCDDISLLKNLNNQRVRELLGHHVPQDEAKLLSNGRLTCTICLHRPVFDTINMLANHRRGKRHLSELSKYIKCKEETERKALQRKRDQPNETPTDAHYKIAKSKCLSLDQSSSLGYKHVATKQSGSKHQRKQILEVRVASKTKPPVSSSQDNPEKKAFTSIRHYLKNMARKTSLEKVVERNRENYGIDLQNDSRESSLHKSSTKSEPEVPQSKEATTSRTAEIHAYEMKLRMTGWIKDLTGKWVKDTNVEFDSDEDETPPPPP